jgi:hypothetical protein
MIQPTALNIVIIGLAMVVFVFLWRTSAMALLNRNPESGVGKAMGVLL